MLLFHANRLPERLSSIRQQPPALLPRALPLLLLLLLLVAVAQVESVFQPSRAYSTRGAWGGQGYCLQVLHPDLIAQRWQMGIERTEPMYEYGRGVHTGVFDPLGIGKRKWDESLTSSHTGLPGDEYCLFPDESEGSDSSSSKSDVDSGKEQPQRSSPLTSYGDPDFKRPYCPLSVELLWVNNTMKYPEGGLAGDFPASPSPSPSPPSSSSENSQLPGETGKVLSHRTPRRPDHFATLLPPYPFRVEAPASASVASSSSSSSTSGSESSPGSQLLQTRSPTPLPIFVRRAKRLLQKLLYPMTIRDFLEHHWERRPFVISRSSPANATEKAIFDSIRKSFHLRAGVRDQFDALMPTQDLSTKSVRLINSNRASLLEPWSRGPADITQAYVALNATIATSHGQNFFPGGFYLVNLMQELFGMASNGNYYFTPRHSSGFAPHFDVHCTLIFQLHGFKKWVVYPSEVILPIEAYLPQKYWNVSLGEPLASFELREGDMLYIPTGFVHRAEATESPSLHYTVGLGSSFSTYLAVIEGIFRIALYGPEANPLGWKLKKMSSANRQRCHQAVLDLLIPLKEGSPQARQQLPVANIGGMSASVYSSVVHEKMISIVSSFVSSPQVQDTMDHSSLCAGVSNREILSEILNTVSTYSIFEEAVDVAVIQFASRAFSPSATVRAALQGLEEGDNLPQFNACPPSQRHCAVQNRWRRRSRERKDGRVALDSIFQQISDAADIALTTRILPTVGIWGRVMVPKEQQVMLKNVLEDFCSQKSVQPHLKAFATFVRGEYLGVFIVGSRLCEGYPLRFEHALRFLFDEASPFNTCEESECAFAVADIPSTPNKKPLSDADRIGLVQQLVFHGLLKAVHE